LTAAPAGRRKVIAAGLAAAGAAVLAGRRRPAFAQAGGGPPVGAGPPAAVDLELVLALDGSESISTNTLAFQLRGHAAAFREPSVVDAITRGGQGTIAVTLVAWSGPDGLRMLVPWTRIGDAASSVAFADAVEAAPRDVRAGSTAIGSAVMACLPLFQGNGYAGGRRTIDLVSNGFSNSGVPTTVARAAAEAQGVTVNALAILNEFAWLEDYFRTDVIAGVGAFTRSARNYDSFADALRAKLIEEIVARPTVPRESIAAACPDGPRSPSSLSGRRSS